MPERTECGECIDGWTVTGGRDDKGCSCKDCGGKGWLWLVKVDEWEALNEDPFPDAADLDAYDWSFSDLETDSEAGEVAMGAVIEQTERGEIASLLFPLPECQEAFNDALNGEKYIEALRDLDGDLRQMHKYQDIHSIDPFEVRELISECLAEYNLGLWE